MARLIPGGYNDPDAPGNDPKHYTGKPCIERDCPNPAGSLWSVLWCFQHNVERMDRISASLKTIDQTFESRPRTPRIIVRKKG